MDVLLKAIQELQDLKRKLTQAIASEKILVQKVLEDAESLSDLAVGKLNGKKGATKKAMQRNFSDHHRFMIRASLDHIESLEKIIAGLDQEINHKRKDYHRELELLQTIPVLKRQGAASILAEIGVDMNIIPSKEHLSAPLLRSI